MSDSINLAEKLAQFTDLWSPHVVAQLNDYDILVVKVQGDFQWHSHPETDEYFQVLSGQLTIHLRDRDIVLNPGEMVIIPRGVEHKPSAEVETQMMLIEPRGTPNTGDKATAAPRREI